MYELPGQTSHSYHILVLIKGERIWHHVLGYVQNSLFPLFKKIRNHLSKITGTYTLSRCGCCCLIPESCLTLPQPHGLQPSRPLFPSRNTGAGCCFLLQETFLTQGSNQHLLHWQANCLPLSNQGRLSKYYLMLKLLFSFPRKRLSLLKFLFLILSVNQQNIFLACPSGMRSRHKFAARCARSRKKYVPHCTAFPSLHISYDLAFTT